MAEICTVLCCSHSPYLYTDPDHWEPVRQARVERNGIHPDVPVDSPETNRAKFDRCVKAFGVLRKQLEASNPDVLVIFGDDQKEQFDFRNFPAFGIFVGDQFEGYRAVAMGGPTIPGVKRVPKPKTPEHWTAVPGCPDLARHLASSLFDEGFDLAFSVDLPNQEQGMGHAFMRPSHYLRPDYDLPTIPVFVNCYYSPQPTARRCYQLGRAVRQAIEAWPEHLRVAVLGSGGLWHTPGATHSYLDETFDRTCLDAVAAGDARGFAEYFDSRKPKKLDESTGADATSSGGTGMLGGLGGGTGETRNWIAAAAVAEGSPGTVVDHVPVYASPCGMAFAYWPEVR